MFRLSNEQILIIFASIFFVLLTNIADLYSMSIDVNSWIPVGSPPRSIGDEYHYFSILKTIIFGDFSDVPKTEISRIIPYIINIPIYYLGTEFLDARYGVLFVRLFDMGILFYALYYFLSIINTVNKWKSNPYIIIFSIFTIFYCFTGFRNIFASFNIFSYLEDFSYIYNHSSINSFARAINSSASAPIILFIFAYRLNNINISIYKFLILLVILIYTSLPVAIAFGLITIFLDIYNKIDRTQVFKTFIYGGLLGFFLILIQSKLIFSGTLASSEVINVGFNFTFKLRYFIAPFIAILISILGRKYFSPLFIITIIILSLFQPLGSFIGGTHGNRLWLRSTILIFNPMLIYAIIIFLYNIISKISKKKSRIINITISIAILIVFVRFGWYNAIYLAKYNERSVLNQDILDYLLKDNEKSIIITNSPEISLLTSLYDIKSKPLMIHYSLQSDGYKKNLARTIVNFELLNIQKSILMKQFKKEAPRRYWLRQRTKLKLFPKEYYDAYLSIVLFHATYSSYNQAMIKDKVMTKSKFLTKNFYDIDINTLDIYSSLVGKKIVFILDKTLPFGFYNE